MGRGKPWEAQPPEPTPPSGYPPLSEGGFGGVAPEPWKSKAGLTEHELDQSQLAEVSEAGIACAALTARHRVFGVDGGLFTVEISSLRPGPFPSSSAFPA